MLANPMATAAKAVSAYFADLKQTAPALPVDDQPLVLEPGKQMLVI